MSEKPTIAAIVITRDEEENIGECLASLSFCDEVVVVDHDSGDRTAEIARQAGAKVSVTTDWPGFGPQKQRALDMATTEWVLSIDADERVPESLAREIRTAVDEPGFDGYRLNRLSMFLGHTMRHGGWYPDRIVRLARRTACRFSDDLLHEELRVEGTVGDLRKPLIHHSYRSVDDVLRKLRQYALTSACIRRERGRKGGVGAAVTRSVFVFIKTYLLQAGFLDGRAGFVAAVYRANEIFWRNIAMTGDEPR